MPCFDTFRTIRSLVADLFPKKDSEFSVVVSDDEGNVLLRTNNPDEFFAFVDSLDQDDAADAGKNADPEKDADAEDLDSCPHCPRPGHTCDSCDTSGICCGNPHDEDCTPCGVDLKDSSDGEDKPNFDGELCELTVPENIHVLTVPVSGVYAAAALLCGAALLISSLKRKK